MPKIKLSALTVDELTKELARREKTKAKAQKQLEKRRAKLLRQLAALDAQIGSAPVKKTARKAKPGRKPGPKPGRRAKAKAAKPAAKPAARKGPKGKRAKNSMTLPAAMTSVMSVEKTMGVKEIAAAVTAAGYKSNSKTFETIIYQALKKNKGFVKASRGQYVLAA
jgi:hypothetical protein